MGFFDSVNPEKVGVGAAAGNILLGPAGAVIGGVAGAGGPSALGGALQNSFIGDMYNPNKGAGFQGQGANTYMPFGNQDATNAQQGALNGINQQQNFVNALNAQNGLGNQSNVFGQQQALANQLQMQANGGGPNPALDQLSQANSNNMKNQAAMMASQRGAGANVGLLSKQAADSAGQANLQNNAQAATMRAQQQLSAQQALMGQQSQMAQQANQMVGQQAQGINSLNNASQGYQGQVLGMLGAQNQAATGMQSNINNVNAGIAQGNQQAQSGLFGGLMSGAGSAIGMLAKGGMVTKQHLADGGMAGDGGYSPIQAPSLNDGPKSDIGKSLNDTMGSKNPVQKGSNDLSKSIFSKLLKPSSLSPSGPGEMMAGPDAAEAIGGGGAAAAGGGAGLLEAAPLLMVAAKGGQAKGKVKAMVSEKEVVIPPKIANSKDAPAKSAQLVSKAMANGGGIKANSESQKAVKSGDSYANDKIPKDLQEGAIVIPRRITQGKEAPKQAAKFVAAILAKQGMLKHG